MSFRPTPTVLAASLLAVFAACVPELEDRSALVDRPRVLAVRSEPAEAKPGERVRYSLLFVDGDGVRDASSVDWAHCTIRKPLTELGSVDPTCLVGRAAWLAPLGRGPEVFGALPPPGCRVFGPDPPEGKPGEPAGRPVDPDPTGGYFQPVRLRVPLPTGDEFVVGDTRLSCGLSGVTQEEQSTFEREYRPNANPSLSAVEVNTGAGFSPIPRDPQAAPIAVPRASEVRFRASWPACGTKVTEQGCPGAEPYLAFEVTKRAIVARRETIRVAFFTNRGRLETSSVGREKADEFTYVENAWTAPSEPGDVFLWLVIRDDRGGVGWETVRLRVVP